MDEWAFRDAIREVPRDDAPLLIDADWIEECGQIDRAAVLRTFVAQGVPRDELGLHRLFTYLDEPHPFGSIPFERADNSLGMVLCWCPPGSLTMGSPPDEEGRNYDEAQVPVTLTHGFWMGRSPIIQGQWERFLEMTTDHVPHMVRSSFPIIERKSDYPVYFDDHPMAVEFARRLTEAERAARRLPGDREYRLPTEAQWEYACRAGTTGTYSFEGGMERLGDYAWYGEASRDLGCSYPAGDKEANGWGLNDMHGNICEWCADRYATDLRGGPDPIGPPSPEDPDDRWSLLHVLRGGCWCNPANDVRSARRIPSLGVQRYFFCGLRVVMVPRG